MKQKLLAISGSTRRNSSNEIILQAIAGLYADKLDVQMYDRINELPFFNPDLAQDGNMVPGSVKEFYRLIEDADGVIICTPEYVFSLPGALKNALEWTVSTTVFSYKPFAFIIASASGEKAFESMDIIMQTLLQVPIEDDCKLLIKGVRGKINEQGEFSDNEMLHAIKRLMDSLMAKINDVSARR